MADQITFHDPKSDADYTIEFDRDSVRFAESIGVNLMLLSDPDRLTQYDVRPATLMSELFYAGLRKHHPMLAQAEADDMWGRIPNKADVFAAMLDMAAEPYKALLGDEADGDPKEQIAVKLPTRRKR